MDQHQHCVLGGIRKKSHSVNRVCSLLFLSIYIQTANRLDAGVNVEILLFPFFF